MTVVTSTSRSGPYAGAGTTGPFTVNFRFLDATHLRVIRTDNTGEHVLVLTTDYTVAGVGNPTGSVTLVAALPVGQTLTIIRDVPKTQEADYVQNDDFPAESHETALDKLTMIAQQVGEQVMRTITFPASDSSSLIKELPTAPLRANKALVFNPDGSVGVSIDDYINQAANAAASAAAAAVSAASASASYDSFDDRWLGPKNSDPILDNDGNPLLEGAAYWNTPTSALKVWSVAGAVWTAINEFIQAGSGAINRTWQAKARDLASIKDYGAIGDNTADNVSAFASAEASAFGRIYLPEGTYFTSGALSALHKHYFGPGKIRTSGGDNAPGRFSWLTARPSTGTGSGFTKFFTADLTNVTACYEINQAPRTTLTEPYFAPETSLFLEVFDNRSGYSGTTARTTAVTGLGATSATVNSAASLSIGDTIGFNDGTDGITNTRVITNIVGNVISWSGGLVAPAPYAIGSRITLGVRTMNSTRHSELVHRGGGDCYIHLMRVEVSATAGAGQDHVFFTATGGFDGGDIVASSTGVYMTGREITFDDVNFDIAVAGDVRTYLRANTTGAREAFWVHDLAMAPNQRIDAVWSFAGNANVGLDLARGNFSTFGNCAIGLASNQRIYFDNSGDSSKTYENWGSVLGSKSFGWESATNRFSFKNGSTSWLNIQDGLIATNGIVEAGLDVSVPTLGKVHLEGRTGDTYLTFTGTQILLVKNGVTVATW